MFRNRTSKTSIAEHVVGIVGSRRKVGDLTGNSRGWISRWFTPREDGGTGGAIPPESARKLLEAAMRGECDVLPEDFVPEFDWSRVRRRRQRKQQ